MRYVCDWLSAACGPDPTTTHRLLLPDRTKYACATHAGSIRLHPAVVGAMLERVDAAVPLAGVDPFRRTDAA